MPTVRPATREEVRVLREALALLGVTGPDAEVLPPLQAADLEKHELLMEAGGDPDHSGVVISGVVREYFLQPDGTEHTRGFALAGDSFGSLSDALLARPSRVFVRAETES